ncbi:Arf guanine nucleotide exchange factor sbh1 [Tulasnella sp. 330]|nr:Arf guanine nucleotide exchange factor sbh1 [Tulasnella sp. 330]KAG8877734.1 Arf guanine nucleotide exchange factor sbh1 [Tulasnella sp. 331]KAG8884408.1 Arf guanine nucleotide exchange factor sbh1 [Tulasnella sp. 332]
MAASDSDSDSGVASPTGPPGRPGATGVDRPSGGQQLRRRATAGAASTKPNSSRAAGAGGSSNTMLRLYTDDSPGLRIDPFVVMVLSISFIGSIFFLHLSSKLIKYVST